VIKNIFFIAFIFGLSAHCFSQNFAEQINSFREKYKSDFLEDTRSPLKEKDFQYLDFYQADSTYCINATVDVLSNEASFDMATHSGVTKKYIRYWKLSFSINNQPFSLMAYQSLQLLNDSIYKNYLFVPFNDLTNTFTTYGGGRYIDLNSQDIKNNQIVLDFNKAYNPYCAFADGYSCPKPPAENNLKVEINAGEKVFLKYKH
jgi:uncharacterized protein